MKSIIIIIAAVVSLSLGYILVFRSGVVFAGKKVETISSKELKQRLDSKKDTPVLLDVREAKELEDDLGHLPGIIHIPIGSLKSRLSELEAEKDKEIVSICKAGVRATKAARVLIKAGFKNILVLKGGMLAYRKAEGH